MRSQGYQKRKAKKGVVPYTRKTGRVFDVHGLLCSVVALSVLILPNSLLSDRGPLLQESHQYEAPLMATPDDSVVALGFVGDIMLDRGIRRVVEKRNASYNFLFERIAPSLQLFDVLFGNIEGAISDRGTRVGSIYSFRMNPHVVGALKKAGFDVFSVANNHSGDWGLRAMIDTWQHIRDAGMVSVGGGMTRYEAYAPAFIDVKGVRVGYVAFSQFGKGYMAAGTSTPGIAIISERAVIDGVRAAKEGADIVVVSFHFGDEYEPTQNAYQERMATLAIDTGAHVVVGHHPHVAQPLVFYNGGVIAYSLGNFVFDQSFSQETMEAPVLTVLVNKTGVLDAYLRTARMDEFFRPGFNSE